MIEKFFNWYERQDFATQAVVHGALIAIATLSIATLGAAFILLFVK